MNTMMAPNLSRADAHAIARRNEAPKQQLPLRRGHFGRVRMTRDDMHKYVATAKSLLDDALNKAGEDRQVGSATYRTWKQLGSHAGFKRCTKFGDNGRDLHYRLQGTVRASLNDLMGIMYADSTAQAVERRELLYNDSLDAQTMCVLKERSAENMQEHISIRWEAINLSNNSPIYQRDMCFLEYTGVTSDVDGIPVGFMIKQSVERKECVSLKGSHGLSRLDLTEIVLLRPTQDASHTELTLEGVVRHPENLPGWLVSSFLGNVATSLSKLPIVVQERLLARLPMISDWQFVPHSSRKNCHVCMSKFSMLSKKINCRSCGEVACKSCIVTRTVGETTKFCTKCILMVSSQTEAIPASEYGSASFITSSSSRGRRDSETSVSTTSSMHGKGALVVPRMRVDMKLLEDAKASRNACSVSSTASETSFDSSNSICMDRRSSDAPRYGSLDEEIVTVDTTDMMRSNRSMPPSIISTNGRPVPTVEAVEDSIAHQRYLLQEMLSQAKTYQQQSRA
ncbi:Myosin-M heavy chain [Phytophthora cinnamomi]|uniref:Myosin-M heavy chain n=1 Tax=Phytophthora cinnamomi TaxID=4785 RepID=UPI00355A492E|nr:Myosin-M heavy chain [Phytophthora cinnamomi]